MGDLWFAAKRAVMGVIFILSRYVSSVEAYMLVSVVVGLRVGGVVGAPSWIVMAYLPKDVFKQEI
jgi:acetamidase/formamidase